jgi:hypothetical protein
MNRQPGWPHRKSVPDSPRVLALAALTALTIIQRASATEEPSALTTVDPAFAPGLATLKKASGFIKDPPNQSPADWQPNLQLLVGVKAIEGSKQTINFVQLTTLPPPLTNATGLPWQPGLRTNDWAWSPSNRAQFVCTLYPVRARVFDETGRLLKEGQTPMAWGMLTNGLMDLCRLSLEFFPPGTNSILTGSDGDLPSGRRADGKLEDEETTARKPQENEALMLATGGGFLWMIQMFSDLQTVPAVANVWEKAQCAVRWPGVWTMLTSVFKGFNLSIEPQVKQVTLVNAAAGDPGPLYHLPVNLDCDKRNLSRVEIIVGPAHGAEMLLAGIRSIHASHPSKKKHEFLAQVLAAGTVPEEK